MKKIIGFGYKRERGKDTSCDYIINNKKFGIWKKDYFAYSLKEGIGRNVFGLTTEQLYGKLKSVVDPFWGMTPREILQRAGTNAMRKEFGGDIWVDTLLRRFRSQKGNILVSDVRFLSEVEAIKNEGGIVIKINRNISFDSKIDSHESETFLDSYNDWDFVLHNNSSFEDLYKQIDALMSVKIFNLV